MEAKVRLWVMEFSVGMRCCRCPPRMLDSEEPARRILDTARVRTPPWLRPSSSGSMLRFSMAALVAAAFRACSDKLLNELFALRLKAECRPVSPVGVLASLSWLSFPVLRLSGGSEVLFVEFCWMVFPVTAAIPLPSPSTIERLIFSASSSKSSSPSTMGHTVVLELGSLRLLLSPKQSWSLTSSSTGTNCSSCVHIRDSAQGVPGHPSASVRSLCSWFSVRSVRSGRVRSTSGPRVSGEQHSPDCLGGDHSALKSASSSIPAARARGLGPSERARTGSPASKGSTLDLVAGPFIQHL
mmetsp:Transcript_134766/g.319448  ORF Transcript_134766/g.319448 Transcript_134766/m.319448 type:complete len:298 (+) Transcript_134766:1560-2453(+)